MHAPASHVPGTRVAPHLRARARRSSCRRWNATPGSRRVDLTRLPEPDRDLAAGRGPLGVRGDDVEAGSLAWIAAASRRAADVADRALTSRLRTRVCAARSFAPRRAPRKVGIAMARRIPMIVDHHEQLDQREPSASGSGPPVDVSLGCVSIARLPGTSPGRVSPPRNARSFQATRRLTSRRCSSWLTTPRRSRPVRRCVARPPQLRWRTRVPGPWVLSVIQKHFPDFDFDATMIRMFAPVLPPRRPWAAVEAAVREREARLRVRERRVRGTRQGVDVRPRCPCRWSSRRSGRCGGSTEPPCPVHAAGHRGRSEWRWQSRSQ